MGYDWLDAVEHKIGQLKRKEKTPQVVHDLADAEDLKSLYHRFVMLVYKVLEKFVYYFPKYV